MKFFIYLFVIAAFISACGVINTKTPQSSPGKDSEHNIFNPEDQNSYDASVAKEVEMWVYKGHGDKKSGQEFCDSLAFVDLPKDLGNSSDRYKFYSSEQKRLIEKLKNDPSLKQLFDSSNKIVCEKEKIMLSSK